VLTTILVYFFHLTDYGVSIIKDIPKGLPSFSIPVIDKNTASQLFPIAFALAIIAYMEAISVAKAIEAKRKNYKVDASQELIALGMANIVGSFFKSYPTTGGFSRSAVNDQAGANTQLSSIIASVLIAVTLLFLTPLFYYLPKTTLAAIIMVAVFGLIDTNIVKQLWKNDKRELLLLTITFLVTLTIGIQQGIITGMILSLGFTIYKISYPHYAILGQIPGTGFYRNIERFENAKTDEEILVFRFDALLFYANINYFKEKLYQEIAKKNKLKLVIINAASIPSIDTTAINELKEIFNDLHSKGIVLNFTGVIGPVRDMFTKTGFVDFVGKNAFFVHTNEAIEQFKKNETSKSQNIALQANKF
jgi:SulP family sulfate permease